MSIPVDLTIRLVCIETIYLYEGIWYTYDTMPVYRVAVVHNILTPYRTVLFDALDSHPEIDLHVYYCAESHQNRNWSVPEPEHDYTILSGLDLGVSGSHFHVNPSITHHLLRRDLDAVIIGGSTNFTMQLSYVVSKISSFKTILWTERIQGPSHPAGKFLAPVLKAIARRADCLVVPTVQACEFQQARGISRDRIVIGPNVVDNDVYWSNTKQRNGVTFLFIGQMIERKGVEYLIDAYAQVSEEDIDLTIVGDGPDRKHFEKVARSKDLDIPFTGWVSEQQKRELLADAGCFVLPSIEDLAPLVLNEAMAASLPVITTEGVGNAPEMITNGENGYIVPTQDSTALANAMTDIMNSSNNLEKMGERSRRIVEERFSPAYTASQIVKSVRIALQ